jgi:hypothetical protein
MLRQLSSNKEWQIIANEMEEKCSLLSDDNYTATLIKINE